MDYDLLGYLLHSLDPDEHRQVEEHVRAHPEAALKLEQLRQSLAPLAAEAEAPRPPSGLLIGTLALVAEYQCRPPLPPAPAPKPQERGSGPHDIWRWVRRADLLVAAALLIVVSGLVTSWVVHTRQHEQRLACQNNLHLMWNGLATYSDLEQNGQSFPRVEMDGPHSIAGIYVPVLRDANVLPAEVSVGCPALGYKPPPNVSMAQLESLYRDNPSEYQNLAPSLSPDYAYSLGYLDKGELKGLRRDSGDQLPILADRPPDSLNGLSPNHDGLGQNVLYIGGDVRWCTARTVGVDGDDIYVNKQGQSTAGASPYDTVLAPSEATPYARRCHWTTID